MGGTWRSLKKCREWINGPLQVDSGRASGVNGGRAALVIDRWREMVRRRAIHRLFFQAEDGIRHADVTGVQTCALPISGNPGQKRGGRGGASRACAGLVA